jgi:hypothetical protein
VGGDRGLVLCVGIPVKERGMTCAVLAEKQALLKLRVSPLRLALGIRHSSSQLQCGIMSADWG